MFTFHNEPAKCMWLSELGSRKACKVHVVVRTVFSRKDVLSGEHSSDNHVREKSFLEKSPEVFSGEQFLRLQGGEDAYDALLLQVSLRKRATDRRALLRKMTRKDEACKASSPICMRVCVCVNMSLCVFVGVSIHLFVGVSIHMCVCLCVCVCVYARAHALACISVCLCVCV